MRTIQHFTIMITLITLCLGVNAKIFGQNTDHLDMVLTFKDSTLLVKTRYSTFLAENTDSLYFILNPGFQVDSITSRGLLSYEITSKANRPFPFWLLRFDGDPGHKGKTEISFTYQIDLRTQNHMRSNWIELNADKLWFPNRKDLNNPITYSARVQDLPESYRLFSHADARIDYSDPSAITIEKRQPWFEVLILAGKDLEPYHYDEQITIYSRTQVPDSILHETGEIVRNSIDLLNGFMGKYDPIEAFSVLFRNTSKKEIGFQFNRRNRIITGTDMVSYGDLSHEIAHFWWSKANFIEEPWMNESFANYGMYKVLATYDPAEYERLLKRNTEIAREAIPVARADLFTEGAYPAYYHKGAILLLELEDRIGEEKMKQLLSALSREEKHSTAKFLEVLEQVSGTNDRDFFAEAMKH